MAYKLIFHREIPDDLTSALDYYEPLSDELANGFRQSVDRTLSQVASHPGIFSLDTSPIRFAKTRRFPYLIFFAVKKEAVLILAILHGSSDPSKWRSRLETQ